MIWRVGIRELREARGRIALLSLLLLLLSAVLGGGWAAPDSISLLRDRLYAELRLPDLDLTLAPRFEDDLPLQALRRLDGVEAVESRLVAPGYLETAGGQPPLPLLIVFLDPRRQTVNRVEVLAGAALEPDVSDSVLVDKSIALYRKVRVGDALRVRLFNVPLRWNVRGVGLAPSFLLPTANPELLFPALGSAGVVYAARQETKLVWETLQQKENRQHLPNRPYFARRIAQARLAERRSAFDGAFVRAIGLRPRPIRGPLCNQLLFRFAKGADRDTLRNRIVGLLKGMPIEQITTPESSYSCRFLEEDLRGAYFICPFSAGVVALLAAGVALITVWRLVEVRRRHIGALMAMGFSARQVVGSLLLAMSCPALAAGVLSLPASRLFAWALARGYTDLFALPPAPVRMAVWLQVACLLTPIVVVLLASLGPLAAILRLQPVEAIRGTTGQSAGRGLRVLGRWISAGPPATRFAIRNLFRRLRFSAAIAVTVGLAIALPASFLTSASSWSRWVDAFLARMNYDAVVTLQSRLAATEAEAIARRPGVAAIEPYLTGHAQLVCDDSQRRDMRLLGLPASALLQGLAVIEGRPFAADDATEILLNRNFFPGRAPPAVGQHVELICQGTAFRLRVVGWVSDARFQTAYVPLATAGRMLGARGQVSGFALRTESRASAATVRDGFRGQPQVALVQTKAEICRTILEYVRVFRVLIAPVALVSGVFCLLFLAMVLSMLLRDREIEYVTLRALGASDGHVARVVLVEVGALMMCALLLAAPFWVGLAQLLRTIMEIAFFDPGLRLRGGDFAPVAASALLFLTLGSLPGIWRLVRLPLARTIQTHIRE